MKKEEICVLIDSEEKRLRALDILEKAGEEVPSSTRLRKCYNEKMWLTMSLDNEWFASCASQVKNIINPFKKGFNFFKVADVKAAEIRLGIQVFFLAR